MPKTSKSSPKLISYEIQSPLKSKGRAKRGMLAASYLTVTYRRTQKVKNAMFSWVFGGKCRAKRGYWGTWPWRKHTGGKHTRGTPTEGPTLALALYYSKFSCKRILKRKKESLCWQTMKKTDDIANASIIWSKSISSIKKSMKRYRRPLVGWSETMVERSHEDLL